MFKQKERVALNNVTQRCIIDRILNKWKRQIKFKKPYDKKGFKSFGKISALLKIYSDIPGMQHYNTYILQSLTSAGKFVFDDS